MPSFANWNETITKGLEYNPNVTNYSSALGNKGTLIFLGIGLILILIVLIWFLKLRIDKKVREHMERFKEGEQ